MEKKKNVENNNYFTEKRKEKRKHSKNKINPTEGSRKQNTKCGIQNTENLEKKKRMKKTKNNEKRKNNKEPIIRRTEIRKIK